MERAHPHQGRGRIALLHSAQGKRLLCCSPLVTLHLCNSAASSLFLSSSGGVFSAATAAKNQREAKRVMLSGQSEV